MKGFEAWWSRQPAWRQELEDPAVACNDFRAGMLAAAEIAEAAAEESCTHMNMCASSDPKMEQHEEAMICCEYVAKNIRKAAQGGE